MGTTNCFFREKRASALSRVCESYLSLMTMIPVLLLVFWGALLSPFVLEAAEKEFDLQQAQEEVNSLISSVSSTADQSGLESISKDLGDIKARTEFYIAITETEFQRLLKATDTIKDKPANGQSVGEQELLQSDPLAERKASLEKKLAESRYLVITIDEGLVLVKNILQRQQTREILHKGPSVAELVHNLAINRQALFAETSRYLQHGLQAQIVRSHLVEYGLLLVFAALLSFWVKKIIHRAVVGRDEQTVFVLFTRKFLHFFEPVIMLVVAAVYSFFLTVNVSPRPYLDLLLLLLAFCFLCMAIVRFFSDKRVRSILLAGGAEFEGGMSHRFYILALFCCMLSFVPFLPAIYRALPLEIIFLVQQFMLLVLLVSFLLLRRATRVRKWDHILLVSLALLVFCLVSNFAGYHNLTAHVTRAVAGTLVAFGLLQVVLFVLRTVMDGIATGNISWSHSIRVKMGLKENEVLARLIWLKFLCILLLWTLFVMATLRLWCASAAFVQGLQAFLVSGFLVGKIHIIPSRIFTALIVFVLLWNISDWLVNRVRKTLGGSDLSSSASEAATTVFSYSATGLAIVAGLVFAGMDFSNLAIIAGALSLGIGFGLQNIVNNFVSGLILLFEQPIKRGDWIVVGNTEGHVKKISVRSTVIRTFDRADVIVPNADLISSQVTNWTLDDRVGRIRVPVSVAYGSDTTLVKKIVTEIAAAHPEVITGGSLPDPVMIFLSFGDSALIFELRCFIRDMDRRPATVSDLNFSIDNAFRENGVVVPFPQRDVHFYPQGQ